MSKIFAGALSNIIHWLKARTVKNLLFYTVNVEQALSQRSKTNDGDITAVLVEGTYFVNIFALLALGLY